MIQARSFCFVLAFTFLSAIAHTSNAQSSISLPLPGPDAFGNSISNTQFNLRNVEATGNNVGLDNADDSTATQGIGFDFLFFGTSYSNVEISSNGFLTFTPTGNAGCCSGQSIPTAGGAINNFIAGYWEDLAPASGGVVRTQTSGLAGSREFVVGFYDVADLDDPVNSINTFEMILHEGTNNIELQYGQIQFENVDDKVIGIENADGTDGLELLFVPSTAPLNNGDLLLTNQGFLISVPAAIPEPHSALLIVGVACIAAVHRRRRF